MRLYSEYFNYFKGPGRGLLLFFLSIISFFSFAAVSPYSEEASRIIAESDNAMGMRDYSLMKTKGEDLIRVGKLESNSEEETLGKAILLYALICTRDTSDFTSGIEKLITEAPLIKENDTRGYGLVTRTISAYYIKILNDFSNALHYATESLNAARTTGNKTDEIHALSALASIYFKKRDPTGWSYALEAYEKSQKISDLGAKYVTACNVANYLYNKGEYEQSLKYLEEAVEIAKKAMMESEKSYLYSFLGDVHHNLGDNSQAEKYYLMSINKSPESSSFDKAYSGMCYTIFLMDTRRLPEALTQLQDTQEYAIKNKISIFNGEIYQLFSLIYEVSGNYAEALENHKKYTDITLDLFSEQKEREFAILDLRNRVAEEQNKNAAQSLELLKRGKTIITLCGVGIIIILVWLAGFIYHRRQMKNYRETVSRYLENAKTEQHLRLKLEEAQSSRLEDSRQGTLKIEKSDELFARLEKMMTQDKLYRDTSLSLEKTATLLMTNRTYLSQVVNDKGGKSFSSYVNDFRLNEAVKLLSDPFNSEPLKNVGISVGFSSPSNFYTLFRQRVGVSPSVFRNNIKSMSAS